MQAFLRGSIQGSTGRVSVYLTRPKAELRNSRLSFGRMADGFTVIPFVITLWHRPAKNARSDAELVSREMRHQPRERPVHRSGGILRVVEILPRRLVLFAIWFATSRGSADSEGVFAALITSV